MDQPALLGLIFYPRREWSQPFRGRASDHLVPVAQDISVSCRFYPLGRQAPSILFFHGNGEVACDYDWIAPLYHQEGINLFVAGYRGYGLSGGSPSFSTMVADAHPILRYFLALSQAEGYDGPLFLMGRSLGSHSALELASSYPGQVKGLILESGFANPSRLLRLLGPAGQPQAQEMERASLERVRSITMPTLVIHGEEDALVPVEQALSFHQNVGSADKRLVLIPGAGHNDLMMIGLEQYLAALRGFVMG